MIAAIDAGNSRIKWGLYDGTSWCKLGALPTKKATALSDVAVHWPKNIRVVACSVAGPAVEETIWHSVVSHSLLLHWVRSEKYAHGVQNGYEQPERLGADRWAALIGAHTCVPQKACLVVCAGTATTIDWLDHSGRFRGGLILPGMRLMLTALAKNTAQLPFAHGEFHAEPRNTVDAIVSGCLHAQAGAIERMFAQAYAENPTVCLLTGGNAGRIEPCLNIPYQYQETLILDGLLRYGLSFVE